MNVIVLIYIQSLYIENVIDVSKFFNLEGVNKSARIIIRDINFK